MNMTSLQKAVQKTVRSLSPSKPVCAVILGSGWGDTASAFRIKTSVPYAKIPCLGSTSVEGHQGRIILAEHDKKEVLIFQGRHHWYEGAGWDPIALPVLLCVKCGIKTLVITNAAGGINPQLKPGDIMLITDHINAMGVNPLVGPHYPVFGNRFPDQSHIYNIHLSKIISRSAKKINLKLKHGVYAAVCGPTYETPSEIKALSLMGADAVGMSTVPEAILANASGICVAGISCITNHASGTHSGGIISHKDVIANTRLIQPKLSAMLKQLIKDITSPNK